MKVTQAYDLVWVNPEHTAFDCMVVFDNTGNPMPFACNQVEVGVLPYVTQLWNGAMAGEYGSIAEYSPPPEFIPTPKPDQPESTGTQTL